jgi:isopentenyl-diphosphate delta-isomerase
MGRLRKLIKRLGTPRRMRWGPPIPPPEKQMLILVDKKNKVKGYARRPICHSGKGRMHRAFVAFIDTPKGIILQKRKHRLWDGFLDVSATSHCLRLAKRSESYFEAGQRCVKHELGLTPRFLANVGSYTYFAKHGKSCENEHCSVLIGYSEELPDPNPDCVYSLNYFSIDKLRLLSERKDITPWLRKALPIVLEAYGRR